MANCRLNATTAAANTARTSEPNWKAREIDPDGTDTSLNCLLRVDGVHDGGSGGGSGTRNRGVAGSGLVTVSTGASSRSSRMTDAICSTGSSPRSRSERRCTVCWNGGVPVRAIARATAGVCTRRRRRRSGTRRNQTSARLLFTGTHAHRRKYTARIPAVEAAPGRPWTRHGKHVRRRSPRVDEECGACQIPHSREFILSLVSPDASFKMARAGESPSQP
jgi:hypothetical protein